MSNLCWAILFKAIMSVESGGQPCQYTCVGDNGSVVGCVQISKAVVDDVNRIQNDYNFTYDDRKDGQKSFRMFKIYLTYWINRYEKNTGNKATYKDYAMCWNGGCHWYKKTNPKVVNNLNYYWSKVKGRM